MDEQRIIRLISEKNEHGIDEFLRCYSPLMRYVITPILPNQQDLEECISDVVLRVWEKIDTYNPQKGKWTTWLTALIRNTALNKLRTIESFKSMAGIEDTLQDLPSKEPSPEEAYLQQEQRLILQKAIERLPRQEQLIFYRKYYYLQPTAQIASELGMSLRAVEGKLYRIKRKLREILGGEWHERT